MKTLLKICKWFLIVIFGLVIVYIAVSATQVEDARKMQTIKGSKTINAPVGVVWNIIADVGNYHKVTTNALHKVVIDSGYGVDMKRTCYTSDGSHWNEVCTSWELEDHFTFVVDTEADDYPLPLTHVDGTWGINPINEDICEVYIVLSYQVANPWRHWLFISSANSQLKQGFDYTLTKWKEMAEDSARSNNLPLEQTDQSGSIYSSDAVLSSNTGN
jgi:ribosome-associated toxin RatA of RatAB toxin-antitoxin module